jgi:hypothetical protein
MQPEFGLIGRTWWSSLLVIAMTSALLYFGKLSEDTWSFVVLGSLGIGAAKSGTQLIASAIKKSGTNPPPSAITAPPVEP